MSIRFQTLVLWGQQDAHISYEMAPLSVDLCEQGRLVTFPEATHWVLHDQTTPFYMMNWNVYYPQALYTDVENLRERAYHRYAARILPCLIGVGGHPDLIGHVEGVYHRDAGLKRAPRMPCSARA